MLLDRISDYELIGKDLKRSVMILIKSLALEGRISWLSRLFFDLELPDRMHGIGQKSPLVDRPVGLPTIANRPSV